MAVSENMETLMQSAAGVAQLAAERAKTAARIAKYHMQILAEQEKIRKLYQNLGRVYYKDYVTDEEPDDAEYEPLCQQISDGYRRISLWKDAIEDLKNQADDAPALEPAPATQDAGTETQKFHHKPLAQPYRPMSLS